MNYADIYSQNKPFGLDNDLGSILERMAAEGSLSGGEYNNGFDALGSLGSLGSLGMLDATGKEPGFGFNSKTLGNLGTGISALGDLAKIYFGHKMLKQSKNQFNTQRQFANRNIGNQAKLINNTLEARYRAALAYNSSGKEGAKGQESLQSYLDRSKVDGSPIGG